MTLAAAFGSLRPADIGLIDLRPCDLWRVYKPAHGASGFNASGAGNTRFSPLRHTGGTVPTIYAGTSVQAALMETVLHDAPAPSSGFVLDLKESTEQRRVAHLFPSGALKLADLSSLGLRRLGLLRSDVIDCDKTHYPETRELARWIHDHCPRAHGILWTSRQEDASQALILFEPRLAPVTLQVLAQDELFTSGPHLATLTSLLDRLGASLHLEP